MADPAPPGLDGPELHRIVFTAQSDLGEGILVVDRTSIVFANEAYCRITGRTLEELRALGSILEIVVPEDRDKLREREMKRARGEDVPLFYETTIDVTYAVVDPRIRLGDA